MSIINPYQAQSLTVALRLLERLLFSVDTLCSGNTESTEGIMVSLVNPLESQQRERLEEMSGLARIAIRALAERFGLKHQTTDLAKETIGRLAEMWAALEDSRARKLRRYGDVDPRLADLLDPQIEELIRITLAMERELFNATLAFQEETPEAEHNDDHEL